LKKLLYIGSLVLGLSACAVNNIAIDDAYHWEDRAAVPAEPTVQTQDTLPKAKPLLEVVSAQDTTITVRINR